MKRVAYVLRDDGTTSEQIIDSPSLANTARNTLNDLSDDAQNVGSALVSFPYNSTFKIIGVATVLYITFIIVSKFVNIKEYAKKLI